MSFLYPRTISITRPGLASGHGPVAYGGAVKSNEAAVASGIAASIQLKKDGRSPNAKLPADARATEWRILFKADLGTVKVGDVITDDLGQRFKVLGNYWNSLGYNCLCERLGA